MFEKGGSFSDCVIFSRMSKHIVCCKARVAKFSEAAKDLERHTMSTGATPAADEVKETLLKTPRKIYRSSSMENTIRQLSIPQSLSKVDGWQRNSLVKLYPSRLEDLNPSQGRIGGANHDVYQQSNFHCKQAMTTWWQQLTTKISRPLSPHIVHMGRYSRPRDEVLILIIKYNVLAFQWKWSSHLTQATC